MTVPLAFAAAAALVTAVLMSVFSPPSFIAQTRTASSYAKDRAAKESAYFDDPKTREEYYATRKKNDADVKFCWK